MYKFLLENLYPAVGADYKEGYKIDTRAVGGVLNFVVKS